MEGGFWLLFFGLGRERCEGALVVEAEMELMGEVLVAVAVDSVVVMPT